MTINDDLIKKLKNAMESKNMSVLELASKADIHRVSLSRILNGSRNLSNIDILLKLSKALGVDLNYFFNSADIKDEIEFHPENSPFEIFYGNKDDVDISYPDSVKIPLYRTKVAATPAIIEISSDEIDGWICIESQYVPKNISERCFAFRVKGDSMTPMLQENDLVAVLTYNEPPDIKLLKHSNIFLVKITDDFGGYGLTLKHIHLVDDRTVALVSDNKKYPDKYIDITNPNNFQVMDRVVWMWREM